MYFDPLSTWLVVLIADGIILFNEKTKSKAAVEYSQKVVKQNNSILNAQIRRIREQYGLNYPEEAYKKIKRQINAIQRSWSFQYAHGQIIIDIDNQDYIIDILEACSKYCNGKGEIYEEYRQRAEWYKNAASEAKKRKSLYVEELEEIHRQKEKERTMSNIYLVIGLFVFVVFIIFFFS